MSYCLDDIVYAEKSDREQHISAVLFYYANAGRAILSLHTPRIGSRRPELCLMDSRTADLLSLDTGRTGDPLPGRINIS